MVDHSPKLAPDGWALGVVGGSDPHTSLASRGFSACFADERCAITGTSTTIGDLTVAGRIIVDGVAPGDDSRAALAATWRAGGPGALMVPQAVFGAVIYDAATGRATLTRDPVGERTMYYTKPSPDGEVWFSDRLPLLRKIGAIGPEISLQSLRDYLTFAYVPGTNTMYADAFEVAAGSTVNLSTGETSTWWHPEEQLDNERSFEENASLLRSVLIDAIATRRPEGPVGVFLSGGVDSAAITALLCHADPTTVHTFSVHFGHDLPNELPFVNQVVERTNPAYHHEILLEANELAAALSDTMAALDDPIGDPLTVPNLALGRRASQIVHTVFNGEGGDPIFGGPKNQPMLLAAIYGARLANGELDEVYLRTHHKCYDNLDELLRPEVREQLTGLPSPAAAVAPYLSAGEMTLFVNRLFAANTRLKGSDHILTKVANLTAATGITARSPLFDRRIVEAAFAMPPEHKLDGTIEKAVLKRAVADLLPPAVINRPKAGMRVPVQNWFRGPLRDNAVGELLSPNARISSYLNRDVIEGWTNYAGDPSGRYGRKLWLLLSLEHWLQANNAG